MLLKYVILYHNSTLYNNDIYLQIIYNVFYIELIIIIIITNIYYMIIIYNGRISKG